MRNRMLYLATLALLTATSTLSVAQQTAADAAQGENRGKIDQPTNPGPKHYYKLNYVLRETDEGKPVNQRTFVVTINSERTNAQGDVIGDPKWWSVRAGTRVPYATHRTEGAEYNYADLGINLDSRGHEVGDSLQLEVSSEISSPATEGQSSPGLPVIRQVRVRSSVLAPFGKSTTVFMADDPASKHRFELDVTPTRER
jgi:hypothetical protein